MKTLKEEKCFALGKRISRCKALRENRLKQNEADLHLDKLEAVWCKKNKSFLTRWTRKVKNTKKKRGKNWSEAVGGTMQDILQIAWEGQFLIQTSRVECMEIKIHWLSVCRRFGPMLPPLWLQEICWMTQNKSVEAEWAASLKFLRIFWKLHD